MSMYDDIDLENEETEKTVIANAHRVTEYARRFTRGRWSFLGPGSGCGAHVSKSGLPKNRRSTMQENCVVFI